MTQTFLDLLQPESFFSPVGTPLGDSLTGFLVLFGVVFALGFILRGLSLFVTRLNPYMKAYLKRLSTALMTLGFFEVLYFLIREARVAYITENIVFIVMTAVGSLWILYRLILGYFVRYKRESAVYKIEQQRRAYLPKRKK